jgi:hypothetical protein
MNQAIRKSFVFIFALLVVVPAVAFETRSDMLLYNNYNIYANSRGAVTAPILNNMNGQIINGAAIQGDANNFTGANTFTGPVTFTGVLTATGLMTGNPSFVANGGTVSITAAIRAGWQPTPQDFGAKCDGSTDDSTPLQAWLNALTPGAIGRLTGATCAFATALTMPTTRFSIQGSGQYQSVLLYTGANTTNDLITVPGTSGAQALNGSLANFRIASNTTMTAGAALHMKYIGRWRLENVVFDGQDGNGKLYHGLWMDGVDSGFICGGEARGQGDAVRINGTVGTGPKADVYLECGMKIGASNVGLRVGGAFGGLHVTAVDIIGNGSNVIIDQSISAESNRELFFDAGAWMDSAYSGPGVYVNESMSGGWLEFHGSWIASSHTCGLQIASSFVGNLTFSGGTIYNNQTDGICNSSPSAYITINGTVRRYNGQGGTGYGFNNIGADPNVNFNGEAAPMTSYSNASGDFNSVSPTLATYQSFTLANGTNQVIPNVSGVIVAQNTTSGDVGVYSCGGGLCSLISTTGGSWVASTTTPAAGKASIAYAPPGYRVYNNVGSTVVFTSGVLGVRQSP